MLFALGYLAGLVTATLIVLTLVFFRSQIERRVKIVERVVESAGPKPRGFVYEPPSEADEFREEVIAKNQAEGKETRMEELL